MAAAETWVKAMPRAIAEGLTGGRSDALLSVWCSHYIGAKGQHNDVIDGRKGKTAEHTVEGGHCDGCCGSRWIRRWFLSEFHDVLDDRM